MVHKTVNTDPALLMVQKRNKVSKVLNKVRVLDHGTPKPTPLTMPVPQMVKRKSRVVDNAYHRMNNKQVSATAHQQPAVLIGWVCKLYLSESSQPRAVVISMQEKLNCPTKHRALILEGPERGGERKIVLDRKASGERIRYEIKVRGGAPITAAKGGTEHAPPVAGEGSSPLFWIATAPSWCG